MSDPSTQHPRRRSRRVVGIALAALVPIVPIVIGTIVLGSGARHPAPGSVMRPLAAGPSPRSAPTRRAPPGSVEVAILLRPTELRSAPGGEVLAPQPLRTSFGSPVVLLVRRNVGGWLGVISPLAGNGRLGWIPRSTVTLTSVDWQLRVSLAHRQLAVVDGGRLVKRFTVAIGAPGAPTPTGLFAVTDRLRTGDPSGPYGCCILALSALAPHAIQDWTGGNRIAIHSTPETWTIGHAISHGCLRLTLAEGRWLIDHVPLGTPTLIRT